jgi:hypothetical protein
VERLSEEFVARYRNGERPALSEYTARHPELAEQIRALFPALVLMGALGRVGMGVAPHPSRRSGLARLRHPARPVAA